MSTVLVLTGDVLGAQLAGPAIRAVEIARYLAGRHKVILGCPQNTGYQPDFPVNVQEFGNEPGPAMLSACDAIIVPGSLILSEHVEKPLIVDLYDPFILSNLTRITADPDSGAALFNSEFNVLVRKLYSGDFFMCASEKQWDFWIGMLAAFRRINREQYDRDHHLRDLLAIVPFGIPEHPPQTCTDTYLPEAPSSTKWVVWGGGIWNWFDPLTLIHAMEIVHGNDPDIRLFFMGTQHPNPKMKEMEMSIRAKQLARELNLLDTIVFFGHWVPYHARGGVLNAAHIGISIHSPHIETQFSFRTRILDYIWAELPIVSTEGDAMADLIRIRRLGITVPASDPTALADAIMTLVHDRSFYSQCKMNLTETRQQFTWSSVLKPLGDFCDAPRHAPDRAGRFKIDIVETEKFIDGCESRKEPFGELIRGTRIQQKFTARENGMNRIDLSLATYARIITGTAWFGLRDAVTSELIVRLPITLSELVDNDWKAFRFDPLLNSSDREYIIELEAPDSEHLNAITFWTDPEASTEYLVNGVSKKGSIGFRYFIRPGALVPVRESIWRKFFRKIRVLH